MRNEVAGGCWDAHIAASEITALEHELGDDAVEGRALVAEAILAGAQLPEIPGRLGNDVVEQVERDTARLRCCNC